MSDITHPESTVPERRPPKPRIAGGARFVSTFFLANAGMYAVFQGMQQILLPSQIAQIDEAGKVASYGVLATVGALAAAVGNPIFGSLSDATRSPLGRRTPWLLASATAAVLFLTVLGQMREVFWLAAAYVGVMLAMSAFQATLASLLPERVPPERRGTISSVLGVATVVGVLYGLNIAPPFVEHPTVGYLLIAALLVVGVVLLTTLTRDPSSAHRDDDSPTATAARRPIRTFFAGLADHDFSLAFWARVSIMLGYWTVSTYQLYTLSDYIGAENLPGGGPAAAVALLGTISLGSSLITTILSGPFSDRLSRRKVFVIASSIGVGIGSLLPVLLPTFGGMVAWAVVSGLSFGMFTAVDQALMTEVLPDAENNARDLGLLNIATTVPQVAAPSVAAVIIGLSGGYTGLFIFAAVAALLSTVFIIPIRKVR